MVPSQLGRDEAHPRRRQGRELCQGPQQPEQAHPPHEPEARHARGRSTPRRDKGQASGGGNHQLGREMNGAQGHDGAQDNETDQVDEALDALSVRLDVGVEWASALVGKRIQAGGVHLPD